MVDMKYVRNLHNVDNKVLSVSPQIGKDNRVYVGILMILGKFKYIIPLSHPKEKHQNIYIKSTSKTIIILLKQHDPYGEILQRIKNA